MTLRLSKIDTLRLAIAYIALLKEILHSDYDPCTYIEKCLRGEISGEHTSDWNTSGKFAYFVYQFTMLIGTFNLSRLDRSHQLDQLGEFGCEESAIGYILIYALAA